MKPQALEARKLVEEILDIERDIDDLQDRKNRLELQLDTLVSGKASPSFPQNEKPSRGRVASENSSKRQLARLLESSPAESFTAEQAAGRLGMNLGTARTNLSKLTTRGIIEKRSINSYGAKKPHTENSNLSGEAMRRAVELFEQTQQTPQ